MTKPYKFWQKLFFFCLGLTIAAAFCMKLMESDLVYNGKLFTVIGLELSYSQAKVATILAGIDEHVRTVLRYHLCFDFVFMAGVYPGIAALNMMAAIKNSGKRTHSFLMALAVLQLAAWGCDIAENLFLLKWINTSTAVGQFGLYHSIVWTKWILALSGAAIAIPLTLKRNKQMLRT